MRLNDDHRQRFGRNALSAAITLIGLTALLFTLLPDLSAARALSLTTPIAQLIAFPLVTGTCIAGLSLTTLIFAFTRRKGWRTVIPTLVWFIVGMSLIFVPYGFRPGAPSSSGKISGSLTVVTFNTGSTFSSDDLSKLVANHDPDIIVLPETSEYDAKEALQRSNLRFDVFGTPDDGLPDNYSEEIAPTSMLINPRLGDAYPVKGPVTSFGTVSIKFKNPNLPTVIGIHAAPPLPSLMQQWREDLNRVINFGEHSEQPLVVAGDFNATLRHGPMAKRSQLINTRQQCSQPGEGTWPTGVPAFIRSPIDHIMVSSHMQATSCATVQVGKSDHAAYVSTLTFS